MMVPEHACTCSGGQMELIGRPCDGCLLNAVPAMRKALVFVYAGLVQMGSDWSSEAEDLVREAINEPFLNLSKSDPASLSEFARIEIYGPQPERK